MSAHQKAQIIAGGVEDMADLMQEVSVLRLALSIKTAQYEQALHDLLEMWDRRDDSGWTAAEVKRLAEIRKLVAGA